MDIGIIVVLIILVPTLALIISALTDIKKHRKNDYLICDPNLDLPRSKYADVTLNDICNEIREDEKKRQRERDERQARRERGRGRDWWF